MKCKNTLGGQYGVASGVILVLKIDIIEKNHFLGVFGVKKNGFPPGPNNFFIIFVFYGLFFGFQNEYKKSIFSVWFLDNFWI